MTRLLLVRHAPTAATERRAFAGDEPITESARSAALSLAERLPAAATSVSSPLRRARQTAEAAGCRPELDHRLAECRFGGWEGRTFAELEREDPERFGAWLRDPEIAPPDGESLSRFAARVAAWLTDAAGRATGTTVAFSHAGVVKAAVVAALSAPLGAFWQLTIAPLSVTELVRHDAGWTVVRVNWTTEG